MKKFPKDSTVKGSLHSVEMWKTSYLGNILRSDKYHLPQLIINGKIDKKLGIGRKKLFCLRSIRGWTGITFEELIRSAEDQNNLAIVIAYF